MLFLLVLVGFLSTCNQNGGFPDKNGENLKSHVGTFKVDETTKWVYKVSKPSNQGKIINYTIKHELFKILPWLKCLLTQ